MTARPALVVTVDGRVLGATEPLVRADDPLFSRGDGVFETVLLRGGAPCLLDAHLARLVGSAAIVGLPAPDITRWRDVVDVAVARWGADDGVLRLVHGRGRAGVVAFASVTAVPERAGAARREGVSAVTLIRRGGDGPWSASSPLRAKSSPLRAKSSSYAVNLAALRVAARQGADDVVFTTPDGVVLEGPRSSVVIAVDGGLRTPPTDLPILPGTTLDAVFRTASARGVRCAYTTVTTADLHAAQGVWLLSSITLAARVHTLDGRALRADPAAVDVAALVEAAVDG